MSNNLSILSFFFYIKTVTKYYFKFFDPGLISTFIQTKHLKKNCLLNNICLLSRNRTNEDNDLR